MPRRTSLACLLSLLAGCSGTTNDNHARLVGSWDWRNDETGRVTHTEMRLVPQTNVEPLLQGLVLAPVARRSSSDTRRLLWAAWPCPGVGATNDALIVVSTKIKRAHEQGAAVDEAGLWTEFARKAEDNLVSCWREQEPKL